MSPFSDQLQDGEDWFTTSLTPSQIALIDFLKGNYPQTHEALKNIYQNEEDFNIQIQIEKPQ